MLQSASRTKNNKIKGKVEKVLSTVKEGKYVCFLLFFLMRRTYIYQRLIRLSINL